MDAGSIDQTPAVKIGDKIRLIRAADPYMGMKSEDMGTIVDYSISKVVDLDELRLVMWIKWENGKESAVVDGIDSFEIL
jgi:Lhr-like helicase